MSLAMATSSGTCRRARNTPPGSDAIADRLTDTVRLGDTDVSLPGFHASDGDGDGDEVGANQHLTAVSRIFDPQSNAAFASDPLGIACHRLGRMGIDVDERDGGVREELGPGQIGDETGGENRTARADDDDFHVRPSCPRDRIG